jgi:hypothetical protein
LVSEDVSLLKEMTMPKITSLDAAVPLLFRVGRPGRGASQFHRVRHESHEEEENWPARRRLRRSASFGV